MNILKSVKSRIFYKYLPVFIDYLNQREVHKDQQLPKYELGDVHIANTKLLRNRSEMLRFLPKGGVVAEIGVNKGEFSQEILNICKPRIFHLIDVWDFNDYPPELAELVELKFRNEIERQIVRINRGYSTDILQTFPDEYFDFVYIDTDHSYETTINELRICDRVVRKGGVISGHDFSRGQWNQRVRFGVVEAVHEFCVKYNWQIVYLTSEVDRQLSFALMRIS